MCGIAGIIPLRPTHPSVMAEKALMLSSALQHRGPDDEGFLAWFESGKVKPLKGPHTTTKSSSFEWFPQKDLHQLDGAPDLLMVHRRLSIIQLGAEGHQPMANANGNLWICHNGEIYNYQELSTTLQTAHQKTGSDTESILRAWEQYGARSLEMLDGFFAFALLDVAKKKLFLCRDHSGVKPLFVGKNENYIGFASETGALRKLLKIKKINATASYHFLVEGITRMNAAQAFFDGLEEVPPGHICTIDLVAKSYAFSPWFKKEPRPVEALLKDPQQVLLDHFEKRLRSDVPLGFAVSGGLDSALTMGMARKLLGANYPLHAFSANNDVQGFEEGIWQQQVVHHVNAIHHKTSIRHSDAIHIPKLSALADVPVATWNNLAHYKLCKDVAAQGIKVFFNGQGADELFGGYPDYLWKSLPGNAFFLRKHRKKLPLSGTVLWKQRIRDTLKQIMPGPVTGMHYHQFASKVLREELLDHVPMGITWAALDHREKMLDDFFERKLGQMLWWEDRQSMGASIESRAPFADDPFLTTMAFNLSLRQKMEGGYTKGILRRAAIDLVPETVRLRSDKMGYSMPETLFTQQALYYLEAPFMSDLLLPYAEKEDRENFLEYLKDHVDAPKDGAWQLFFRLSSLALFIDTLGVEA